MRGKVLKKNVGVFLAVLFVVLSASGCEKLMEQEKVQPGKAIGKERYTGFDNLPKDYTAEQAIADGCVVYNQNKLAGGRDKWDEFVKKTQESDYAKIRIRQNITEADVYYEDVIYKNGKFRLIISTDPEQYDYEYSYLQDLKGKASKKLKYSRFVFLTDEKEVSFEQVLEAESVTASKRSFNYQMIFHE
ncbi:MAG: hypothetical protein PHN80_03790 [Hespellia sp.]|nr:hypothetical protein [Hespellia sp.]